MVRKEHPCALRSALPTPSSSVHEPRVSTSGANSSRSPDRPGIRPSWDEITEGLAHAVDEISGRIGRLIGVGPRRTLSPGGSKLPRERVDEDELRIFVFGDSGTGEEPQMFTSAAMTSEAAYRKPHFAVDLGDIIYEDGVESPEDPVLKERVDVPYESLGKVYLIGGNHDHHGDIDALVAFAQKSKIAVMPARYYQFGYAFGDRRADFFVLDTDVLEEDPRQLAWLTEAFRSSDADYRIVLGHHPILSGGEHGDSDFMRKLVLPLIDGKAQLAGAGHDHDQQVLSTSGGTLVLVSGAAAKTRDTGVHDRAHFAAEGLGFSALTLGQEGLTIDVIDAESRSVIHREALALDERPQRPAKSLTAQLPWTGAAPSRFARSS